MIKESLYLPQEIWNQIVEKLDEPDIEQVSLVCKQLLAITNPLKTNLKIFDETLPILPGVLRRFQHLENIIICVTSCYADILRQISNWNLNSRGRKSLKALNFGKYCSLVSSDLIDIVDLIPWLGEISIPCPTESPGFKYSQLKPLNLRKVTFRWFHPSICSFLLNCANLEEIEIELCREKISQETIGFMMRHCPNLTSLKLPRLFHEPHSTTDLSIPNSITYLENLRSLSFYPSSMSNTDMYSFVEAKPPLHKLELHDVSQGDARWLMMLLQACSSIQELRINYCGCGWITDSHVEEISNYLPKLTHIHLNGFHWFSIASFFTLTKNCPFLEVIQLQGMSSKGRQVSLENLHKREKIRHLDLYRSSYLDDKTLAKILWVCPNLQSINVSWCTQLTEQGMLGILKTSCASLTELYIFGLEYDGDIFEIDFKGKSTGLKIIEAGGTGLKDKALSKIANICTSLEYLSIRSCEQITENGVMEVVRNCKKLKKINLHGCNKLSVDMLIDMVSMSSIKRIVLPDRSKLSKDQEKVFWNNGCRICYCGDQDFPRVYNTQRFDAYWYAGIAAGFRWPDRFLKSYDWL